MTREEMDRQAKECLSSLPSSLSVQDRMAIEHQEMPSQDAKERIHNMDEVALGYSEDMAVLEASRCLNCKNPRCVQGCPVNIQIPQFISAIKERNLEKAGDIIRETSMLPSVCGRVCPQERQCEGNCVLGIKGLPVAIGALERYVGDNTKADMPEIKPDEVLVHTAYAGICGTDHALYAGLPGSADAVPPIVLVGVVATSVELNPTAPVTTTAVLVALERVVLPCVCNSAPTSAPLVWRHAGSNAVPVVPCVAPVVKLPVTSIVRKSVRTAVPITVSMTVPSNVVVVPISVTLALACVLVSVRSSVNRAVPTVPISVPGGVTPLVVRVVLPIVPSSVSRLVPTAVSVR